MKSRIPRSEASDLLTILAKVDFTPTVPYDQQIVSHVRQLIQKQKIPTYTKLPSIRELADLWGTSHHTTYDALNRLAGEGLVVLRPRQGSFVAPSPRLLRRVCLYHHFPPIGDSAQDFYIHLDVELTYRLAKRGVTVIPYYDRRTIDKLHTMPEGVRTMASEGDIDALIATVIYPTDTPWLFRLEVPVASLMLMQPERKIEIDLDLLARKVVLIAVQSNRKTIGLIHPESGKDEKSRKADLLRVELERHAAAHGVAVICPENLKDYQSQWHMHWEQYGAEICENLLNAPTPPDMIFVYPDSYVRGVAMALKGRVAVPEKVLLVSHRNAENTIYLPFPMTWITVKIGDFADALIEQLDSQIAGKVLTPITIDLNIETTTPFTPSEQGHPLRTPDRAD